MATKQQRRVYAKDEPSDDLSVYRRTKFKSREVHTVVVRTDEDGLYDAWNFGVNADGTVSLDCERFALRGGSMPHRSSNKRIYPDPEEVPESVRERLEAAGYEVRE
jgi:hypothetical protein